MFCCVPAPKSKHKTKIIKTRKKKTNYESFHLIYNQQFQTYKLYLLNFCVHTRIVLSNIENWTVQSEKKEEEEEERFLSHVCIGKKSRANIRATTELNRNWIKTEKKIKLKQNALLQRSSVPLMNYAFSCLSLFFFWFD